MEKEVRKIILFIAMSLDGYIADCHGKVDWVEYLQSDCDGIVTRCVAI